VPKKPKKPEDHEKPKHEKPGKHKHPHEKHSVGKTIRKMLHHAKASKKEYLVKENLRPNDTYIESINMAGIFTVPYAKGDSVAVHIIRSSDMYDYPESPELYRCMFNRKGCVSDKVNKSLSFELSAGELPRINGWNSKGSFQFSLYSQAKDLKQIGGVVVGMRVCVGKNVSLATCRSRFTRVCYHGKQSSVMEVCICDKGYTGRFCEEKTTPPKTWEDEAMDEFECVFEIIAGIVSFIVGLIFLVVIFVLICGCCACLRACCRRHVCRRGAVIRNRNLPVPPPPYAYRPLDVPPPPPPPPMEGQVYDVNNGIEMSVIPAARNPNPIYVMPPLAPVKQVPVFVTPPPAPKN